MGDNTKIEWTQSPDGTPGATWNPLRARNKHTDKVGWFCTHVSEGCRNCYAEVLNKRIGTGDPYTAQALKDVELFVDKLDQPARWKRPRKIFVNSMTDLFLADKDQLWKMFTAMRNADHHTYLILTKRPEVMRDTARWLVDRWGGLPCHTMPEHIWLGVSVEDQKTANERIPILLETQATIRFVSYEPAIGPVDFNKYLPPHYVGKLPGREFCAAAITVDGRIGLDWIIVGGESGPHARPFNLNWARQVIHQCEKADVPVFLKQLGAKPITGYPTVTPNDDKTWTVPLRDQKGGDESEWPMDLQNKRAFPRQK